MSNICDNKFLIYSDNEETVEKLEKKLNNLFEDMLEGSIDYSDMNLLEGYFSSKWTFPHEIFKDFFEEFEDESIYMRCLSEEYGCSYVAMNIYRDNCWKSEQTFDL